MINHMVSDPVRAITSAKKRTTKAKYENTYLEDFEKLVPYGSDKVAYEARVEEIINYLRELVDIMYRHFPSITRRIHLCTI